MGKILTLNKMLRKREISAEELAKAYISAIEKDNAKLGAYVNITEETALSSAKAVDRLLAGGERISPLAGIPMTLKDNISTKGIETTCCSKILGGYVPVYNATVWEKLMASGAVLLGKTNMDEFAMGSSCESSCFFSAKNPHDLECTPGGSSGGGAAAVSGNLAVYALGSDTGGSVRQPASLCGIVGLKPTYGAVSRYGLIAYASSLDQIGVLASSVQDASLVFDAIAGSDKMDSTTNPSYCANTFSELNKDIKGRKIGVPKEFLKGVSKDVEKAFFEAVKTFEDSGARVIFFEMPALKYCLPVYYILACAEASSNLGRYDGIRYGHKAEFYESVHEMVCKTRSEGFGDEVKRRILLGTYVLSKGYRDSYYKKAQNLRSAIVSEFDEAFRKFDVILTPTSPTTAWKLGKTSTDPVEDYQADICTTAVNIAGLPGVSIPCGFDKSGLPVGMQIIGNKFEEGKILCFANRFEKITNFKKEVQLGVKL